MIGKGMYDFFRKTLGFGDVTVYFEWYDNAKDDYNYTNEINFCRIDCFLKRISTIHITDVIQR